MTEQTNVFATEPEIAVLSLVINNPDLVYNLDGLKAHMFSSKAHQAIISTMMEIGEKHLQPDYSLLINYIVSTGKLELCGGESYLTYLKNQAYLRENFPEFIRFIKDSYKAKSLISLGTNLTVDTINLGNVNDQITNVQNSLERLLDESSGEGTFPLGLLVKESYNEIVKRVENPGIRGITCGLTSIDSITGGLCGGDLWYAGGRPGSGKTSIICSMSLAMGKIGVPNLIFSKEMARQPIVEKLLAIDTEVPLFDIRMGLIKQDAVDKVHEAAKQMSTYPLYIDLNFTGAIEEIESTIRKYHATHGVKVFFIDYIQLLAERNANQTQELGRISRKLKLLANSLDVTIFVLSQLNRDVEYRDNKRPTMPDLRQCGNLEEDADFVIGLYRDEYYNADSKAKGKMEFIILKARNGPTGTVVVGFDAITTKVKEN